MCVTNIFRLVRNYFGNAGYKGFIPEAVAGAIARVS